MEAVPWRSARPLYATSVARVVGSQSPARPPAGARYLDEGWDSEVYEVTDPRGVAWIFRFPKRARVQAGQRVERALLPRLEALLQVPIPRLERFGEPGGEFPFSFLGYRRLEGVPASLVPADRADLDACATVLAAFLSRLHAFPVEEARRLGVSQTADVPRPTDRREHYRTILAEIAPTLGPALARRAAAFLEQDEAAPRDGPAVLVHDDLGDEHVLLSPDGRRVVGVIDWGDVAIGDPAVDFAGLWKWLGEPLGGRVLDRYEGPLDPGLVPRARAGGTFASLSGAWYGVRTGRPEYVASGLRGLTNCLPDDATLP